MYQKQRMAVFYLYKISPRGRYCQQRGYVPVVTALIRTVILYLILIVGLRLTGKRQIGELEPIELVLTMLLSDLASVPMQNFGIPLLNGLVPIVTLLSLSMLLSWCSLHSVRFRSLVCGEPAVIIRDGKLEQAAMRRNRLTLDELLEALRAQGVTSLGDVKYAILETSGQLSVLLRADCQPATPSQLGLYVRDDVFLPEVIINDGRLLRGNLERLRLDDAWLKKQLQGTLACGRVPAHRGRARERRLRAKRGGDAMRALRLPCIALAALLALALVNSLLLSRWCARWGDLLDAADACVQAEDWAGADAALENLRRDWDARQTWLHIVIEHGEINEAESLLRRCLVLCTAQERTDLRADLAALRSQMVLLNEMERVSVKNIL